MVLAVSALPCSHCRVVQRDSCCLRSSSSLSIHGRQDEVKRCCLPTAAHAIDRLIADENFAGSSLIKGWNRMQEEEGWSSLFSGLVSRSRGEE